MVRDRARSRFRLLSNNLGDNQGQMDSEINGDFYHKKGAVVSRANKEGSLPPFVSKIVQIKGKGVEKGIFSNKGKGVLVGKVTKLG